MNLKECQGHGCDAVMAAAPIVIGSSLTIDGLLEGGHAIDFFLQIVELLRLRPRGGDAHRV